MGNISPTMVKMIRRQLGVVEDGEYLFLIGNS
jgi:hypothetical protein